MFILKLLNYTIPGYGRNELSVVNTLHEIKLWSSSRTREHCFVSVCRVYSVNIDNILMWIYEVLSETESTWSESESESESELLCNWQSVSQYVLVSSPIWDFWPEIFFVVVGKLLSCHLGAPSRTRGRVCHLSVYSQSTAVSKYLQKNIYILCLHIWH
jgi:hypothetical protein